MLVYKFGGASVSHADGVKNLTKIVAEVKEPLILVVSAMGKMTNAFESLVKSYFKEDTVNVKKQYQVIKDFHFDIMSGLFELGDAYHEELQHKFKPLWKKLEQTPSMHYDFEYDQIVSYGELFSTFIVSSYLKRSGLNAEWLDVRKVLKTNEQYREAEVNWELSSRLIKEEVHFSKINVYVTQGFIGGTINNLTTTLGREGSDYSAAIFGYVLEADYVAIWKDVPGILNADPRWYPSPQKIDAIPYREAIELSFYGAQVIHPKTIKPLQNKQIPLLVKSFINPHAPGTEIFRMDQKPVFPPVFILKQHQILLTISPKDFSFIVEESLSDIFRLFTRFRIKLNHMHNSALNFSACIDHPENLQDLLNALTENYQVRYNDELELLTIRHYTQKSIDEMTKGKEVIDSQISRGTARFVVRKSPWFNGRN
jgi:aspartate kinase